MFISSQESLQIEEILQQRDNSKRGVNILPTTVNSTVLYCFHIHRNKIKVGILFITGPWENVKGCQRLHHEIQINTNSPFQVRFTA